MARRLTIALHGDPQAPHQARLAVALLERGHRPIVVDAPGVVQRAREEFDVGLEHWTLPRVWPAALRDALVRRWVRAEHVDVAHLNYLHLGEQVWQRVGVPYIATAWGSDLNDGDFARTDKHWQQMGELLRGAAAVTADSQPLLDRAQQLAGPHALTTELVLWGVDCAQFDPALLAADVVSWRARLGIADHAFVVLSPRQTLPHYHPERILRGFAAMAPRADDVLVFKLHGRDTETPVRAELESLAAHLGIADRVRFAPPCRYEQLAGLYAAADVAVSALEVDGVPSTFAELMALRVPLVVSDLAAYGGILGPRRALRFAPKDFQALGEALRRLRDKPDVRAALAQEARAWALGHADWRHSVDAWIALYRRAAG